MRQLASIQRVVAKFPIEGADAIERIQVLGWNLVAKLNEFQVGDLCIYIEIDSQCPSDNPHFAFLERYKYRVKTQKLRGVVSQGLALPINILPEKNWKEGDDVTAELKITKYDPQATAEKELADKPISYKTKNPVVKFLMKYKWFRKWWNKRTATTSEFPTYLGISKTDETRIQGLAREWEKYVGKQFHHTEKMDGQSGTFFVKDKTFGVCSRNLWLKKKDMSTTYWDVAIRYDIENFLFYLKDKYGAKLVVLQGEICGPSTQGNRYKFTENTIFVFNIKIDGRLLETPTIIQELKDTTMRTVPYLGLYTFTNVEDILKYVEGKSVINPKADREGCVFRCDEISFKAINNQFLLKEKD